MTSFKYPLACLPLLGLVACANVANDGPADGQANQDTRAQAITSNAQRNQTSAQLYGAELYSQDKVHFGRFDIRMKLVNQPGVVSSFFTYDNESWQGEGRPWREIDFEAIGKQQGQLQTNLITGTAAKRIHSEHNAEIVDLEQFHDYTLIWTPDEITWMVNGEVIRQDLADDSQQVVDMRSEPQSYRANIWVSEVIEWVGRFDESQLPMYQVIDSISYAEYIDGEFVPAWRDDFEHFDDKRWGKGDWGFDSNIALFSPDNLQVIDGKVVLALTLGEAGIKPDTLADTLED
ncbi:family 16 glycosylhydrolase [Aliagarivorans taiwanensis]|uniref:family 16 glycosylhydrolase n=1 Tax=Aliagarivorans taiwanensis TaxID=561966 RepID=UPI000413ECB3|nr:family 16 glycosylhydrolase [Aliagarivorans taiwanensis]